jgi:phage baseplate assembly protein W
MVQPTSLTRLSPREVLGSNLELSAATYIDINPQFNLQTSSGLLVRDEHAIMFGSLYNLLVTPSNGRSRIFQEDYSCGLMSLLQEPLDNNTAILIEMAVKQAVDKWEPRVRNTSVKVRADPRLPGYNVFLVCNAIGLQESFSATFQFKQQG